MTRAPYDHEPLTKRERIAAMAMQAMISTYILRWRDDRENTMIIDTQNCNLPDLEADMDELIGVAFVIADKIAGETEPTPEGELCDE